MTNDLVTRLRALAERAADGTEYSPDGYWIPDLRDMSDALREAADALETATIQRRVANLNNEGNLARAEKAEAEAAALREAATAFLRTAVDIETTYSQLDVASRQLSDALSQPGPGAALLERVRTLEAELAAWKAFDRSAYVARVKKLEGVAEAVVECRKIDRIVMGDIMTPTVINMSPFKRLEEALAALEEKP